MGSVAGLVTAYHFRNEGPLPRKYDLGDDAENELIDVSYDGEHSDSTIVNPDEPIENTGDILPPPNDITVNYTFVPKEKKEEG